MFVGVAHTEHPEAPELVPSAHCLLRFRERMPVRTPGGAEPAALLLAALRDADVTRWPPGWAVSDRPAELWAVTADLAFPLARTPAPGPLARRHLPAEGEPVSLADMRRSYEQGGLAEADLAGTWLAQFRRWLEEAVSAGITEPNAMVLATADDEGAPSSRTVLLKAVDERGFVLYTNLGSRKGAQALANPRAAVTFPWIDLQRQVGVTGRIERVDDAESDAYFTSRPHGSQLGAHASPQSSVVSRAELEERQAALEARYPEGTAVPRPAHWGGLRVVPDGVEFWQGRPNRLHDRLRFRAVGLGLGRRAPGAVTGANAPLSSFAELPGEVEQRLAGGADRVGVLLLDAFGWAFVQRHLEHPLLRRCATLAPLASQFPSTTTAHVTTMHSGLPVGEHGLYEWNVLEPSAGRVIVPLTSSWTGGEAIDGAVPAEAYVPTPSFYERLAARGVEPVTIEPSAFCPSVYDRAALRGARIQTHDGVADAARQLAAALSAPGSAPRCVFAYASEIDTAGHVFGPSSPAFAAACRAALDALEAALFGPDAPAFAPGTVLLLTADHGQVDVHPSRTDHVDVLWPELTGLLTVGADGRPLAPAGSARDLFLHVRPEHVDAVVAGLRDRLGERASVHRTADVLDWLGPVGPRLRARLAEVLMLPGPGRMAWWSTVEGGAGRFLGHHGGRTAAEAATFLGVLPLG